MGSKPDKSVFRSVTSPAEQLRVTPLRRSLTLLLAVAALITPLALPATAALKSWTVRVVRVNDGDTFDVDANGDGAIDYKVRFIGINAAEGHMHNGSWQGTCHSHAAYALVKKLVLNKRVTLRANSFNDTGDQNRKIRFINRTSDNLDVDALELKKGLAVAYPNNKDPQRNGYYNRLAKAAAAAHKGLWNPTACGYGPHQSAKLKVYVHWWVPATGGTPGDAVLNHEYVRIENHSSSAVPLNGWVLRDSSSFYYYFGDAKELPAATHVTIGPTASIPAHGAITVHSGHVPSGKTDGWGTQDLNYYWGLNVSAFAQERLGITSFTQALNPSYREHAPVLGDGAYLYDTDRDLRAYMTYPCVKTGNVTCKDSTPLPLQIGARLAPAGTSGNTAANEQIVSIKNTGSRPVDLSGYYLDRWPYNYEFRRYPATVLQPGDVLRIHGGTDPGGNTSTLNQYWGLPKHILWHPDYLELRQLNGTVDQRVQWSDTGCTMVTGQWECGHYN
jgi:endonuclease YncB( thermonuclease family)